MKTLLELQELDLRIEACKTREIEIPKQKGKYDVQKKRLAEELQEREQHFKKLQLELREAEGDINEKQAQIRKYDQQLYAIKDNEAYQALLHEIDFLKKQIALKEERMIALMVELDEVKDRLEADRKRIEAELKDIDRRCVAIDVEYEKAVKDRAALEQQRGPLVLQVSPELMTRYNRIRASKKTGPAVVPLKGEVCSGCHMYIPAQIVNEVLAGKTMHTCNHCGRLLYHEDNYPAEGTHKEQVM